MLTAIQRKKLTQIDGTHNVEYIQGSLVRALA